MHEILASFILKIRLGFENSPTFSIIQITFVGKLNCHGVQQVNHNPKTTMKATCGEKLTKKKKTDEIFQLLKLKF